MSEEKKHETAVVLLQMGGPTTLDDVQPFIRSLLSDPEIMPAPTPIRQILAWFISWRRAPMVRTRYMTIGGGSPIGRITADQAIGVESHLQSMGISAKVFVGMRYTKPSIDDAIAKAVETGAGRIVLLPLFPQYSMTTTKSALDMARQAIVRHNRQVDVVEIESWANDPGYIDAIVAKIRKTINNMDLSDGPIRILYSAHGLPIRLVERGDPYPEQVAYTVKAVQTALGSDAPSHTVCFQSRLGPVKWLEPSTEQAIEQAARDQISTLVVVPVAFVSDHIETLHEIDIEYREFAIAHGIRRFARVESLNDDQAFTMAIARLISNNIN